MVPTAGVFSPYRPYGSRKAKQREIEMDYEKAKRDMARLVKACKTVVRQAEGGHAVGHDAIVELHRSLKLTTPELKRPHLDGHVGDADA